MQLIRLVADLSQSTEEIKNTFRQTISVAPKSKIALIGLNGAFEYDKVISADDRRISVYDISPVNIDLPLGTYTEQELVSLFQQYLALYAPYQAYAPGTPLPLIRGSNWTCVISLDNRFDLRRSSTGVTIAPYQTDYSPAEQYMEDHVTPLEGSIEFLPSALRFFCVYIGDTALPNGSVRWQGQIDSPGVEIYQGYYTGFAVKIPGGTFSDTVDNINEIISVAVDGTNLDYEFTENLPDDLVPGCLVTIAGINDPGGAGSLNCVDGVVSNVVGKILSVAAVGAGVVVDNPNFGVANATFKGVYSYRIANDGWTQVEVANAPYVYNVNDKVVIKRGYTAPFENWVLTVERGANLQILASVEFTPAQWSVYNQGGFAAISNTDIYPADDIYGTPKITNSLSATKQNNAREFSLTFDAATLARQLGFPNYGRYVSNALDSDNRVQQLLSPDKMGFLFPNPGLMVLVEPFILSTYSGSSTDKTPSNILYVVHDPSSQGDSDTVAIDVPSPLFLDINNEHAFNLNQMKVRFSSINGVGTVRLKNRVSVTVAIEG
jgi:hypothetical protein